MTDADLRALFEAWLRDRAQVHKLAQLSGAVLRAYTEAVTAAAVRTTYPPQVRASVSPAIGNPACVSPDADGERQPPAAIAHADGSPLRADRLPPVVPVAEVSLTRDVRERWESGPMRKALAAFSDHCAEVAAGPQPARRTVEHTSDTGRLGQAQDDFARRPR